MTENNKSSLPKRMAITAVFAAVAIAAVEEAPYALRTMAREINDTTPGGLNTIQMIAHILTDPFEDNETLYKIEYGPHATVVKRTPIKELQSSTLTRMIKEDLRARPDRLDALAAAAKAGGANPILVDIFFQMMDEKIAETMAQARKDIEPIIKKTEAIKRETDDLVRREKELERLLGQ